MEGRSYAVEYATQRNKWMDSGEEKRRRERGKLSAYMRKVLGSGESRDKHVTTLTIRDISSTS